ncbi:MAG: site-specific integrase [Pseudomonadota bacterium]
MKLTTLVDEYVLSAVLRPKTIDNYRGAARILSAHLRQDIAINEITDKQLLSFRDDVLRRASPQTFNNYRRHLSVLFKFAVRRRYLVRNPFDDVRGAPVPRGPHKTVKKSVLRGSIARVNTDLDLKGMGPGWFWMIVLQTMYFTGMRRRQVVNLQWGDIDFVATTIRLRAAGSKTRLEWNIPLSIKLAPDLLRLKRETEKVLGCPVSPSSQVFQWPLFAAQRDRLEHEEMTVWQLDRFFKRLSAAMQTRISAHRIRHTTATELANKAPNLRLVQELLGHTDLRTTTGYVHPDLQQMQRLLDELD